MPMTQHEENLFALAERLSMGVWQLKQMPVSEYFGWMKYFQKRQAEAERQEQINKGNLLAMSTDEMIKAATGGG
jgi:hypothetical protein